MYQNLKVRGNGAGQGIKWEAWERGKGQETLDRGEDARDGGKSTRVRGMVARVGVATLSNL